MKAALNRWASSRAKRPSPLGYYGTLQQLTTSWAARHPRWPRCSPTCGAWRASCVWRIGCQAYTEAMEQLHQVANKTIAAKVAEINLTTPRSNPRTEQLKNFFAVDFGADLVKGMAIATQGVDPLVAVLSGLTQGLPSRRCGRHVRRAWVPTP